VATKDDETSLKRLGGGRWQTRDERFTIESQSGTWVVVDAEQTDDLGLPRVRGPYPSLTAAKEAIPTIRDLPAEESPLAKRIAEQPTRTAKADRQPARGRKSKDAEPKDEAPAEPAWLARLSEERRRDARRLIRDLEAADLPDPIGLARRELEGDEPAVSQALVLRRLAGIVLARQHDAKEGESALELATELVTWLTARSRDPDVPMRLAGWRFVEDGDAARRIEISRRDLVREIERLERRTGSGREPGKRSGKG
jgi:hypothetical protein